MCSSLDLTLQLVPQDTWSRVAPSVFTDSRRRLDETLLATLFTTSVAAWESDALIKDKALVLNLLVVDGTTFRCHDSEDNVQEFGIIFQKHKPYPQLCLVGLLATETRFMVGLRSMLVRSVRQR